jgi:hypothetical protein
MGMKFDFKKRIGEFGKLNIRDEIHGDKKVKAVDLKVTFPINKKELDMLAPIMGSKLSSIVYDAKGNLQTYVMSPLQVHRNPEHLELTIYDQDLNHEKYLTFIEAEAKGIVITFEEKGVMKCTVTMQFHPGDKDYERLCVGVMGMSRQFEVEAKVTEDMFESENDKDEENDGE